MFYDLVVPDFRRDPVMLSGILVTAASAQRGMTAMPDPAAPAQLPAPAVSRRTFARDDRLTVFAEIYDNIPGRQPRQIDTAVTLLSESGQEVFAARDGIDNPPAARWTTYGLRQDVPLEKLAAGRYLLKIEAGLRGGSPAAVRETLIVIQ